MPIQCKLIDYFPLPHLTSLYVRFFSLFLGIECRPRLRFSLQNPIPVNVLQYTDECTPVQKKEPPIIGGSLDMETE